MKFKDLTPEDRSYMVKIHSDKNMTFDDRIAKLAEHFGIKSERTVRRWLAKLKVSKNVEIEPEVLTVAKTKTHDGTKNIFLITSAQNATKVHSGFLKNMEAYAEFLNAEILVIPFRYKNPTSMFTANQENDDWWDSSITKYLTLNRHDLNDRISVLSDVKIQPTATEPLQGLEGMTGEHSCVVGHPRVHLKTSPVLDVNKPRYILSTGAITKKNYTDSKAGKKGEFHHTFGAVIVELSKNDEFFVRQITAEDKTGAFIDLFYEVNNGKVTEVDHTLALVKGDIHYGNHDDTVLTTSLNKLVPNINPKQIILHDIFDGYSINHHEANNFVVQYQREVKGTNSLKKELDDLLNWLDTIKHHNLVVVFSNHDDFLTRFIINGDPKKNVKNALEYMEYAKILLEGKAESGLIPYLINQKFNNIKCLGRNESYKIKDWELGIHGMDGINGSRGSINQYRKLNTKVISAHAHSPMRLDGALQVGTNTKLRMGYNNGISTWSHSDVIIHKNGKAQHILYNSTGEFTTLK